MQFVEVRCRLLTILLSFQGNIYLVRNHLKNIKRVQIGFLDFLESETVGKQSMYLGKDSFSEIPSNIPRGRSCSGRGWEFLKCLKNKSSGYVSKFHEGSAEMPS